MKTLSPQAQTSTFLPCLVLVERVQHTLQAAAAFCDAQSFSNEIVQYVRRSVGVMLSTL